MTALSYEQAAAHVTGTNPTFEVTQADIRGVTFNVFKNIPPHVPALLQASHPAHDDGKAEYLVFEDQSWTFDAFCQDVKALAHSLRRDHGVIKGQPVAIAMRNCPELLMLVLAISSVGAVTVFVNAWWTTQELDYALKDSRARLIFADKDRAERLQPLVTPLSLRVIGVRDGETSDANGIEHMLSGGATLDWPTLDLDTDDDFAIMYSSGTTGHPKGVVQTHRGAVNAVFTWLMQAVMAPLIDPPAADAPEARRPAVLIVTPLFHVTATHPMFLLSLPAGAKLAVMAKWDADRAIDIIQSENITRFLGVPTQSADLLAAAERRGVTLDTLDFLGSGGAKRPAAQVGSLAKRFPNASVAPGWGMTETNANGIGMAGPDYEQRPGSAGRLYPPIQQLRFLDDDGNDVAQGEIGEITVKSPCNMRCYLNKPDATAETMQDGWLRTGDLGMIDESGFVTIVDRKKNIIIRGGENIACLDVEGALHRHPDVAEACAFSVPHDRLGEVVGAAVQLKSGTTLDANTLREFLTGHIARFKIPEHLWFQATPLTRGATDKIDRRALRALCLDARGSAQ
ncbi:MAG: class I adenylate-forming enzyme family protein [Sedimentitalea sp.]